MLSFLFLLFAARVRSDAGQTAAEYALVLLGVATIALLVVTWATRTEAVGRLLDAVFDDILSRARSRS